jgi:hypothetical protein
MFSLFATRRKRSGDKGHAYMIPLSEVNKGEFEPFIKTAKEAEERQSMTQVMKGTSNPRCVNSNQIYN